jgi:hypothetical protein
MFPKKEKMTLKDKSLLKYLIKINKINNITIKKLSEKKILKLIDKKFEKLSEYKKYKSNEYILLQTENKKYDYLYCNEIGRMGKEETIFEYKNVLEWDKKWWEFQKESLEKNANENYFQKKWYEVNFKEYNNLYMQGEWFRWIEKDTFGSKKKRMIYGILEGLRSHIVIKISEKLDEEIDKLYPNMFYSEFREPLFSKIPNSKYLTMKDSSVRAGGFEKELEELQKRKREEFPLIEEYILERIKPYSNFTFTKWEYPEWKTKEKDFEGNKLMIFGGLKSAENICFKTFLDDFYSMEQPYGIIENLIIDIMEKIKEKYFNKWISK